MEKPKNLFLPTKPILWTNHAKMKMKQYQLSESRVKRVIRFPKRIETGIVEKTISAMKPLETSKKKTEIWVMYNLLKKKGSLRIISAWRYPGETKEGQAPPIPEDTLKYLLSNKEI